jgi:hypothetical protein
LMQERAASLHLLDVEIKILWHIGLLTNALMRCESVSA